MRTARWIAASLLVSLVAVFAPVRPAGAVSLPTPLQLRPELVAGADQLVIVATTSSKQTVAYATLWERRPTGWVKVNRVPYFARVGRNGTSTTHVEGDGTTPAGSFPLLSAFGLATVGGTKLAYTRVRSGHCWISDTARADYNTMVVQSPCGSKNEDLYRIARGGPYTRAIVTGYNISPIVSGKGSAIFIHLHARTKAGATKPTSGCVSLSTASMATLWRWVDPAKHPRVVIGPTSWLQP